MKIAIITNHFPPLPDGVGDYSHKVAVFLAERGHQVDVLCRRRDEIAALPNPAPGLSVHPCIRRWNAAGICQLQRQLEKLSPDCIYFQYVPYSFNRYGVNFWLLVFFLLQKVKGRPTVTNLHETYIRFAYRPLKYIYPSLGQRLVFAGIAFMSDKIITSINRYQRQTGRWNKSVSLIPVGSNIVRSSKIPFSSLKPALPARNSFLVTAFGNKDSSCLLDIFGLIREKIPGAVLFYIGKVQEAFSGKNYIYQTGYVKNEEVHAYLRSSDLFISADPLDSCGRGGTCSKSGSLSAALAAALPVIGIKGDMTDELLLQESNIFFLERNFRKEPGPLWDYLADHKLMRNQARHNLAFFEKYLTDEKIGTAIEQVLIGMSSPLLNKAV